MHHLLIRETVDGEKGRPWLEDERCRLTSSRRDCRSACNPTGSAAAPSGLVIVDEVHGFCTLGAGDLAPQEHDPQIADMIVETDRLARRFAADEAPDPGLSRHPRARQARAPYPLHCEAGSGEENQVPELEWLEDCGRATTAAQGLHRRLHRRHRGELVGGGHGQYHNKVVDWINSHRLKALIAVGICTDICVSTSWLTLLSARNHGLMPTLQDIVVYEPGCATYDLPLASDQGAGPAPDRRAPARPSPSHRACTVMASRGAVLASELG